MDSATSTSGGMPDAGRRTVQTSELTGLQRIASGGTASIWRCELDSTPFLFKKFDGEYLSKLDVGALAALVAYPATLAADDSTRLSALCAWPVGLVETDGRVVGTLMQPAPEIFWTTRRGRQEPRHVTSLAVARGAADNQGREYFQMPHKIGRLGQLLLDLRFLHRLQIVVGDLQPSNVLTTGPAAPGHSGPVSVFFIDCDSFAVRGRSTHAGMDPLPYKAPSSSLVETYDGVEFTVRSDLYKFAVLTMRCLAEDLSVVDIEMDYMRRYLLPFDLHQLNVMLDAVGEFSDSQIAYMGRSWRSCIAADGRLQGRSVEAPADLSADDGPTRGNRGRWRSRR